MLKFGYALLASLAIAAIARADTTAVQDGGWSDPATWGGTVPAGTEEDIVIPAGLTVTLNTDVECGQVLVHGRLEVERADRSLTCDSLIVQGAGAVFEAGTDGNRFTDRFLLTLKGEKTENFQPAGHGSMGARALLALMGGSISLHGEDRVEWTRLGASAAAGATAITVSEPVDWRAGDIILVASSRTNWNEAEQRSVASVSGDGLTVTLTTPLSHPHTGVVKTYTRPSDGKEWTADLRAEVGLLSRNITIQGAADSVAPGHLNEGFGAHVMVHGPMDHGGMTHPAGQAHIKGVEIFRGGQKSLLARYPFHWHLCIDQGAGQYFNDNAVHLSFNRAITIHGTDYTTVENNFCYDHLGHGLFLEDGAERFNTIRKNVVLLTKRPAPGEEVIPSDNSLNEPQNRTPASYWITNPNNTFEDNVAAGTEGTGFWFIMPTSPVGPSRNLPYYSGDRPYREPLGAFSGNTAHSCMNGFDIFDQLGANHSILRNGGWSNATPHVMDGCTWYANNIAIYAGIGGPALNQQNNVIYRDNVFVDNKNGLMLATYNVTEDSVFVADSGHGLISGERRLYLTYDGAGTVRNCHLVGWNAPNANLLANIGAATKHVNHRFSGITTDHAGTVRASMTDFDIRPPPDSHANHAGHPRFWSIVLVDEDGSLSGQAGASIVSNHPFLLVGDEFQPPNWTRVFRSPHRFALAVEDNPNRPRPNVAVVRSKPGTPDAYVYYIKGYNEHHQLPLIVNEGFLYTYSYETLPGAKRVTFRLDDATAGDTVTARFRNFGKLGGLSVSGHGATAHGSLANLQASGTSGFYIEPNGDLYLRPVATGKSQTLTISWSTSIPLGELDSDGDSISDGAEILSGRNAFDLSDLGARFEESGNFEKWDQLANISGYEVSGGALRGTSTGDSQIVNGDFNFDATGISQVHVRMKASANSSLILFWARNGGGFSAPQSAAASYTGNGEWRILTLDLAGNSNWLETITALRLDPISGVGDFEIDWIRASNGDADGDGIPDDIDGFTDLDGDGVLNLDDLDSDGDGKGDRAESAAAGRDPYDVSDLVFHFDDDDDFEGWTQWANVSNPAVSSGLLTGEATSNDPVFYHLDFHVPSDQVDEIAVRFRSDAAGFFQFFFGTSAADSFSGTRRLNHPYTAPGEWQIARFPVAAHQEWTGHITRMRVDPGTVSGSHFEIDWIRATDIPTNLTNLGGDHPVAGDLSPGALDFYTIPLAGLSRVIINSGGATGTIGTLYGPGGSALNVPGGGPQFSIDRIIATPGELTLVVQGSEAGTSGPYELLVEVIPLEDSRPDATIGMRLTSQRGDDVYDPSGVSQKIRRVLKKQKSTRIFFTIQNDAGLADVISVRGTGGNRKFKAIYTSLHGGANITASVRRAGFQAALNPLSDQPFLLRIKPTRRAKRGSRSFRVDASSAQVADRIMTRVKVR